ncbi:hypothetical protein BLA29_002128 [Euroglyphus maynei]|uniref:Ras-associating domain-containing protein n=1 Tax=Euroglyphus maynei TaxID=6958 RepID=A0A1Y3BHU1_EURMA|nr:hypothetical protein BLA29_002128 [Euroglyphus maynei]
MLSDMIVFAEDDSSKCLLADERMTVGKICQQMAEKNHISMGINYCIIEHMPQLYLDNKPLFSVLPLFHQEYFKKMMNGKQNY